MAIFTKDSLERLRQRVDLVEALSPYIELKRAGAAYKGLCPFHDEKSPSFIIQKGDSHYHCFGCGAHGDAIQFLMVHQKMGFSDAVEMLAERFQVVLEKEEGSDKKTTSKPLLKEVCRQALGFFHFCLLHTEEGVAALRYLQGRGIDLAFINQFQIGYAPKTPGVLRRFMHDKKISDAILLEAGLIAETSNGRWRDFFSERILFPIHNAIGDVIGFSGRKFREETFGGKYVNTPETPLFKKSRVLFGLNYSRRRIAKERKVIIVEGQIDTLRLIREGFDYTVAGQGTAFGEEAVKELFQLGINKAFLCLDSDKAGREAAVKIGHLLQKHGAHVVVATFPPGEDPDSYIRKNGSESFQKALDESIDYLDFLVRQLSEKINIHTPAGKNELLQEATSRIKEWNHPVMVHETLKKLAQTLNVPEEYITTSFEYRPNVYLQKKQKIHFEDLIDGDLIIESDFLRWLVFFGQEDKSLLSLAFANIKEEDLKTESAKELYASIRQKALKEEAILFLSLATELRHERAGALLDQIGSKKINKERAQDELKRTIEQLLTRNWMQKKEEIRLKSQTANEEEAFALLKAFNTLNLNPPKVQS